MVDRVVYLFVRAVALFVISRSTVFLFFYFFPFVCVNTAKRRAGEVFAPSSMFQLSCIVNTRKNSTLPSSMHTIIYHSYSRVTLYR